MLMTQKLELSQKNEIKRMAELSELIFAICCHILATNKTVTSVADTVAVNRW